MPVTPEKANKKCSNSGSENANAIKFSVLQMRIRSLISIAHFKLELQSSYDKFFNVSVSLIVSGPLNNKDITRRLSKLISKLNTKTLKLWVSFTSSALCFFFFFL